VKNLLHKEKLKKITPQFRLDKAKNKVPFIKERDDLGTKLIFKQMLIFVEKKG
jgi:hypothetical protein